MLTKNSSHSVREARLLFDDGIHRYLSHRRRDWMQSRQYLRRAIETGDLFLFWLVDVVGNIIGV